MAVEDFDELFAALRPLLERHAGGSLAVVRDEPDDYQVQTNRTGPSGTYMWFGAVQTRASHVSLHLMPVYSHPDLLGGVSDELRERLQGKGCFNLTPQEATPQLLGELSELVDLGVERYRADGLA
ncbi:hypothetical protein BH20ACT16_BH20ACT16_10460 [soil metagenome]|jgi:hypothetical protein